VDKRAALLIAILLSILHALLAITASQQKSPTYDEPTHLAAGYSYWLTNDFRLDPENGSLSSRWNALPLLVTRPNFPIESNAWKHSDEGGVSREFFYHCGNDPDALLMPARAMNAILSGALCFFIFICSRELFGLTGAFISELVAVFDPNLLAHGGLATSDTAAALLFFAATWSYGRMLQRLTMRSFVMCAVSVAALFLAKMSAVLFLPVALVLTIIRARKFRVRSTTEPLGGERSGWTARQRWRAGARPSIAILVTVLVAIWAASSFRFAAVTDNSPARRTWDNCWTRLQDGTAAQNAIALARDRHLLPEAYLLGFAYTLKTAEWRPAFLDGEWSRTGFRSFFLRAFIYKTPLSLLLLLGLAGVALFLRWRLQSEKIAHDLLRVAPLLALLMVYGGSSLTSHLNIGHRHLLPIYPPLFVLCGMCAWWLRPLCSYAAAGAIAIALSVEAAESFACHPNYIAYFNPIAGSSDSGYKHLVDSSLDWGQDLPSLREWLERNVGDRAPVYFAYFGSAEPRAYGILATPLPSPSMSPGVYCISATILQHVYETEHGKWTQHYESNYRQARAWHEGYRKIDINSSFDRERESAFARLQFARLCAHLRQCEPLDNVGGSVLIYRVTAADLDRALLGAPPE
jgi:hypothetical protein